MKKNLIYFVFIISVIIIQTSVVPVFFSQKNLPDLVLMLMLAWTIRDGFIGFLPWLVLAGISYDFLTYVPFGLHVLIFAICAYSVSFFSRRFLVHIRGVGILIIIAFVFFAMLFSRVAILFTEDSFGTGGKNAFEFFQAAWNFSILSFVFNFIFLLTGLWVIKRLKKYFYI